MLVLHLPQSCSNAEPRIHPQICFLLFCPLTIVRPNLPGSSDYSVPASAAGDLDLSSGSGRCPGEGKEDPSGLLASSIACRGAWRAALQRAQSRARLKRRSSVPAVGRVFCPWVTPRDLYHLPCQGTRKLATKSDFAGPSRFGPGVPCSGELALSPPLPLGLPHRRRHRTPVWAVHVRGALGKANRRLSVSKAPSVSAQPGDRVCTRRQTTEGRPLPPPGSPAFPPSLRRRAL